jgi:hypothetical protein
MGSVYAVPGAIALIEWLLATALYAFGWYRTKYSFNRVGDGLVLAGSVTSLAGVAWLAWDTSPKLALARSSLATGLAVSALAVYAVLARRRMERASALLVLGFAILVQAYAVGRLWWRVEVRPQEMFLPLWAGLHAGIGSVGYGALVVCLAMITHIFAFSRMRERLSVDQLSAAVGLRALEWQSLRIALVALSVSLSVELIRTWWGRGQVMTAGFVWALTTWLLLAAGAYGLMQGAIPRRPARALLILASVTAIIAVLAMPG